MSQDEYIHVLIPLKPTVTFLKPLVLIELRKLSLCAKLVNGLKKRAEKRSASCHLSGIEFNVDKEKGLTDFCDFIISASQEQLTLSSPVITVVEAKNENIIGGLGQCIAEMVAASIFNRAEGNRVKRLYGMVMIGTAWKFMKLKKLDVLIDLDEYSIEDSGKIIGILFGNVSSECLIFTGLPRSFPHGLCCH